MKIAIVVSRFNKKISDGLLRGALRGLGKMQYDIFEVPGAFEIPFFIQKLTDKKKYSGFIALGCVLKGETDHYRAVCGGVTYGIQKVTIENRVPVMFGVLMCAKAIHALSRSGGDSKNKGYECAASLLSILKK